MFSFIDPISRDCWLNPCFILSSSLSKKSDCGCGACGFVDCCLFSLLLDGVLGLVLGVFGLRETLPAVAFDIALTTDAKLSRLVLFGRIF